MFFTCFSKMFFIWYGMICTLRRLHFQDQAHQVVVTLKLLSAPNPGNSLVSSAPADSLAPFFNLSITDGYGQGSLDVSLPIFHRAEPSKVLFEPNLVVVRDEIHHCIKNVGLANSPAVESALSKPVVQAFRLEDTVERFHVRVFPTSICFRAALDGPKLHDGVAILPTDVTRTLISVYYRPMKVMCLAQNEQCIAA